MIFKNRVKEALKQGRVVIGPMVSEIRTPGIVVLLAQAGFDFLFIDMEHSCFTTETMSDMILAARTSGISPIVRPPSRTSAEYLSRPLDMGAEGLLIPQIRTRKDVENIVKWSRYPPLGERGMALSRQHTFFDGGDPIETMCRLNEEILVALQIEHRDAIERLPEILAVPGIDAAFVGPADLSASLGKPGQTRDAEFVKAVHRVIETSEKNGIVSGIHANSLETARYWMAEGVHLIGFYTDIKLILEISKNAVRELRACIAEIEQTHGKGAGVKVNESPDS